MKTPPAIFQGEEEEGEREREPKTASNCKEQPIVYTPGYERQMRHHGNKIYHCETMRVRPKKHPSQCPDIVREPGNVPASL